MHLRTKRLGLCWMGSVGGLSKERWWPCDMDAALLRKAWTCWGTGAWENRRALERFPVDDTSLALRSSLGMGGSLAGPENSWLRLVRRPVPTPGGTVAAPEAPSVAASCSILLRVDIILMKSARDVCSSIGLSGVLEPDCGRGPSTSSRLGRLPPDKNSCKKRSEPKKILAKWNSASYSPSGSHQCICKPGKLWLTNNSSSPSSLSNSEAWILRNNWCI